MFVDKNFNIENYKKIIMRKYNLTEKQWQELVVLANLFRKCDDVTMFPSFIM